MSAVLFMGIGKALEDEEEVMVMIEEEAGLIGEEGEGDVDIVRVMRGE
jgi:hypothetical protein